MMAIHHYYIDRTQGWKRGQKRPHTRIINGYTAEEGDVPYIVRLTLGNASCGGTIIGDTWILTAAHCLSGKLYATIYYGSNEKESNIFHRVLFHNFIIHELYEPLPNLRFDIALVRTPRIEFSDTISQIALPAVSDRYDRMVDERAKVCGWGLISLTVIPEILECIDVRVITNEECFKPNNEAIITDSLMCTGTATCFGDSGGPLVTDSLPPKLIGIVKGHFELCNANSVFTRVTSFLEWIHGKTNIPISE
ncbi:uncharacterized protein Dwil_GK27376 [Drosophila willistoni]|uniref:Peptidase S1 domain-containing protein n=1 Tax=Drosophila willistoni TaxID=7260 RepID=A0A0Q9X013_DROWI|nr:serine protease 3 [Drosophila willistoni]KRF97771.1 uncharacterized protein Dwil_GK27376 [Drosophila willistoni]